MQKEIDRLKAELTGLNIKLANSKIELKKVEKGKVATVRDIADLQKERDVLSQDVHKIRAKLKDADDKAKVIKLEAKNSLDEANKEKGYLEQEAGKVNDLATSTEKGNETLLKAKAQFKQDRIALGVRENSLEAGKRNLKDEEKKIEADKKAVEATTLALQNRSKELDKASEEVEKERARLKAIEKSFVDKRIEQEEREGKIQDSVNKLNKENLALLKREQDVKCDEENKKEEYDKIELQKKGIKNTEEELERKKDEIEITRLRVEKIIRDKNIKAELKKLQKELA